MKKKIAFIFIFIAIAWFAGLFIFSGQPKKTDDDDYRKALEHSNRVFSVVLPDKVEFAGEAPPLGLFYVREGLDRELTINTYWHSSTLTMMKRAARYFPVIEPILKANGVPDDFKYLALIESGLSNVESPAGASGIWQIVDETAKRYGLEIGEEVDERYELSKSTSAACRILKTSFKTYGNWTLAAAAYNAGEGRISKELGRQKVKTFYDLYMNNETSRYLFRILALKILYENPTQYGYYLRKKDLYPYIPTYTVAVDSSITNLVDFALYHKLNYKILKEFNPWLRKDKLLNPSHKKYIITFPKEGYTNYTMLLNDIKDAAAIFNDSTKTTENR
ncbi:MAG: lytic transglycosylase domain-containing protein [Bacteroidales bacterium]